MTDSLLNRIIVPIANREDTTATCEVLLPHLDETVELVNILYVIEQTDGYIDPTSPEALKQKAQHWFTIAGGYLDSFDGFQTEIRAGFDVVDEINASAVEHDATAIVFRPTEKRGLSRLFSSDVRSRLPAESPCPVIALNQNGGETLTEVMK